MNRCPDQKFYEVCVNSWNVAQFLIVSKNIGTTVETIFGGGSLYSKCIFKIALNEKEMLILKLSLDKVLIKDCQSSKNDRIISDK